MYKIHHIGVAVKDMDRSLNFYQDILNCLLEETYEDENISLAYLKCPGGTIELACRKELKETHNPNCASHIGFLVSDIEKEFARLKEKNVALLFDAPKTAGDKKIFFFTGPDGEMLEFLQI